VGKAKTTAIIVGAVLIHAAYPLQIITDIGAMNYLLTSAGASICFLSMSSKTLDGKIFNIIGTLQAGYFLLFLYNDLIPVFHFKVSIYSFMVILGICLVVLCLRSALRK
jgi:hypothetical protein